jgi:hypothetical protein
MSIKEGVGKLFQKAKEEANEMAQTARLTLELRQLEGRRDLLYGKIGRRVYKRRDQMTDLSELEPIFAEVGQLESEIQSKEEELRKLRGEAAPTPPS